MESHIFFIDVPEFEEKDKELIHAKLQHMKDVMKEIECFGNEKFKILVTISFDYIELRLIHVGSFEKPICREDVRMKTTDNEMRRTGYSTRPFNDIELSPAQVSEYVSSLLLRMQHNLIVQGIINIINNPIKVQNNEQTDKIR